MGSLGSLAPVEDKVHIVLVGFPFYGHIRPLRSLATSLVSLGYTVTFIAGSVNRESIMKISGVEFVPFQGRADFDPDAIDKHFPGRPEEMTVVFDMENIFIGLMPEQFDTIQSVLRKVHASHRKTLIIQDGGFAGTMPMLLGSTHISRVPVLALGHFPLMIMSEDTAPFGTGLPSQGKEKNIEMNAQVTAMFSGVHKTLTELIKRYDCELPIPSEFVVDNCVKLPDLYMQLCPPSLEPHRSDLPQNVRFCGTLVGSNDRRSHQDWWEEFVTGSYDTPLVIVTSGSLAGLDFGHLIEPTIQACKHLMVRLVVCGVHVVRPKEYILPSNIRWAEWIAFEDIFPYTSLVVSSGGYGGISQAFASGIPMVLAGTTEDKTETALRAEATGAAINLRTQTPSVEQVKGAVQTMLSDTLFKNKALEMKKAYADCNALGSIVKAIEELVERYYPDKQDSAMQTPAATGGASPVRNQI